jgi:hypothetical protein
LEGGYLNFDKVEFSLVVRRVVNDGCWCSGKVVVNHQVKQVLQDGEAWGYHAKSSNGFGLDKLWTAFPKSSTKKNAWLGALVTSGCLGSDLVKKEEIFICKINVKQACENGFC